MQTLTEAMNGQTPLALMRLLQLSSSNLPVGGYSFSQGLEYAIDANWLNSPEDVRTWIEQVCLATLLHSDLPLISRLHSAYQQRNWDQFDHYNDLALAIRETKELLLADLAMGEAL
ncbi:MAG: urease accessory UreF family protein, partial [Pseudomonadota bacterium]